MIQLGVSHHPIVTSLLQSGTLPIDYLEVHGPYIEAARADFPHMPMLLHNSLYQWSLAHPDGLQHMNGLQITQQRLAIAQAPWYSLHLGFSAVELDFEGEFMHALTPALPRSLIMERFCSVLTTLASHLDVPILIENLDYNPGGVYEHICEPGFIAEVLARTGTHLLLDLAHVRVSAAALGISVPHYLEQLPMECVRQIHLNQPGMRNGRLADTHEALAEQDYTLFAEVLRSCQPWAVTLEYNRDATRLLEQVKQLRTMLQA